MTLVKARVVGGPQATLDWGSRVTSLFRRVSTVSQRKPHVEAEGG